MTNPSEERQPWSRPELTPFGTVAEMTATFCDCEDIYDDCENDGISQPIRPID